MRILGLDYGSKTVGCALTDELGMTAQPYETVFRREENKLRRTLARIEAIIQEKGVDRIVLGLPINMDGTSGERVQATLEFKEKLERRTGLPVILWDERLTTFESDRILEESGVPCSRRKEVIDQIAASLILREYMDQMGAESERDGRENRI